MGNYSIKDLEKLTGIKAHTLRAWEQRYGIIQPKRTNTDIRTYDDEDLRLTLNIAYLNRNGHKISKIAGMEESDIYQTVLHLSETSLVSHNQIHAMVLAMINLDEGRFEKIIATNTLQIGFERTMLEIVYPFLHKIGILWQTGNIIPAHEHFMSNLIRQKLIVAIDGQMAPEDPHAKKFVLFLPEGELHELSLLFAAFLIKARKFRVIYLGQNLPIGDLKTVYDHYEPEYFLMSVTSTPTKTRLIKYVEKVKALYPKTSLLISGYQASQIKEKLPEGVHYLDTVQSLLPYLEK